MKEEKLENLIKIQSNMKMFIYRNRYKRQLNQLKNNSAIKI